MLVWTTIFMLGFTFRRVSSSKSSHMIKHGLMVVVRCYRHHEPMVSIHLSLLRLILDTCPARSMTHDEFRYPNPHMFLPERFLNDDGSLKPNDCENIVFGFGRRNCVGRHFADTSIWSVIAKVLAVFTILNPLDANGVEIPVEPKFSSGAAT